MDMDLSNLQETVKDREAWRAAARGVSVSHDSATEQQQRISREQTSVYPQPILQRKSRLLKPLKWLFLIHPPYPPLAGNNSPKFRVYSCLLKIVKSHLCIPKLLHP